MSNQGRLGAEGSPVPSVEVEASTSIPQYEDALQAFSTKEGIIEETDDRPESMEAQSALPSEIIISAGSDADKKVDIEETPKDDIMQNETEASTSVQEHDALDNVNAEQPIPPSDADIAAEASGDVEANAADDITELRRLRDLVFASRGSRSNLPPGWDDEAAEQYNSPAKASGSRAPLQDERVEASLPGKTPIDEAAQKMLQRAIDVVGQYGSDRDSDDDSSASDSASSSASVSSTSHSANKGTKTKKVAVRAMSEEEEEGGAVGAHGPTTKNEVIEPTVDQPPYSSVPFEKEIRPLGKIHSIVDCVVVVAQDVGRAPGQQQTYLQGAPSHIYRKAPIDMHGRKGEEEGEYSVLDTGSLLAFADRNVLGVVFETFGSVLSPLYALRYSSASQVNKEMIQVGKPVFYVPGDSTYVLTRALRALGKGSDASNLWDEEVGDDEREFSDDEAEAEHRRSSKASRGKGKKRSHPEESTRGGSSNSNSRPIKHSLPTRPTMAPPVHRDAASNHQNMNLMYDDDDNSPRQPTSAPAPSSGMYSPAMPYPPQQETPSHDPYALWNYQQQQQQQQQQRQQQQQQQHLPPQHHYSAQPPNALHYPQTFHQPLQQSYYPTMHPISQSYDPQQPYLGPPPAPQ